MPSGKRLELHHHRKNLDMTDTQKLDAILEAVTGALSHAHLIYHRGTGTSILVNQGSYGNGQPEGTFATGNPARSATDAEVLALVRAELDRQPDSPTVTDPWLSAHALPALRQRFAAWTEQPLA